MSKECDQVHTALVSAGFGYLGSCSTCPQRIKRYQMGRFVIKAYGTKCTLKMFETGKLVKDNVDSTKVQDLIQKAIQESSVAG
jgi:hypothetical protein